MIQILSNEELKAKLAEFQSQGFNQVKLPGGTSKDGFHYSGLVFFFYNKDNKTTYFLGLPYNSNYHKNGENNDTKKYGESPKDTARREAMEETGLMVEISDLKEMPGVKKVLPGKIEGTTHSKIFFLVEKFSGTAFQFLGSNPIDAETGAPMWFQAKFFKQVLWAGHQPAFKEACNILAAEDKDVCMSLIEVL